MMMDFFVIGEEERRELVRLRELLESMIETVDVLLDEELLKGILEAEEDMKAGRIRRLEEFEEDLRRQGLL